MKTVILTGAAGFVGTYLACNLLNNGYRVIGFDNYSKYGKVVRPQDSHTNYKLIIQDLAEETPDFGVWNPDYIILGAAMIGGISYFHKYAFDLVRTNEKILARCYDSILDHFDGQNIKRVVTVSSSMVFEGADKEYEKLSGIVDFSFSENEVWPSKESHVNTLPPPISSYGAQKAFTEVWARAAWDQYKLPYTIVRPFNCVGAYENEAKGEAEVLSGNVKLMMSHVLPDLVNKCLKGQDPLHILGDGSQIRCYTHGDDIARGIVAAMESPNGVNNDFNISNPKPTSVLELASLVWSMVNPDKPFNYVCDEPFEYDVQKRIPDVRKAEELLAFKASIPLEQSVKETIQWLKERNVQ